MNILYINHPEGDYGGSFLYNGLCCLLGAEHVFDYPVKHSYHGQVHRYSIPPAIINGMTAPYPYMKSWPYQEFKHADNELQEVRERLARGEFDLVIVESFRALAVNAFSELQQDIARAELRVVAQDGEDYDTCDLHKLEPDLLLKREMTKARYASGDVMLNGVRILSFPFSSSVEKLGALPVTELDVTFSAGNTCPDREEVTRELRGIEDAHKVYVALAPDYESPNNYTAEQRPPLLPWKLYVERMRNSALAVSVRGWGRDTCRYWEAASVSLLLADDVGLHTPHPYVHGATCLQYTSARHCAQLVHLWCKHADRYALAQRCVEHTKEFHTNIARARYALEACADMGFIEKIA